MRRRARIPQAQACALDCGYLISIQRSTLTVPKHLAALVVAFALLYISMQREVQVHELQHLGGILHPAQEQGFQAPAADATCLECSLLAGGASAMAAEFPALPLVMVATSRALGAIASRSLAAPSYYSSRAPPSLL
jgi:hypothetical protein